MILPLSQRISIIFYFVPYICVYKGGSNGAAMLASDLTKILNKNKFAKKNVQGMEP